MDVPSSPSVSVVMSVYNGASHLAESVASILNQSFDDFEFIIINDGSTDGSALILDDFARTDPRIKILHQSNAGLPASLNTGIAMARGEIIARMDADDVAAESRFDLQVSYLRSHPEVGVVGGQCGYIDEHGGHTGKMWHVPTSSGAVVWKTLFRTCIPHPGSMIRRSVLQELGGYDSLLRTNQDYDLWTRALFVTKLSNVSEIVVWRRVSPSQLSQSSYAQQQQNALRAMHRLHSRLLGDRVGSDELLLAFRDMTAGGEAWKSDRKELQRMYAYVWQLVRSSGQLSLSGSETSDALHEAERMLSAIAFEIRRHHIALGLLLRVCTKFFRHLSPRILQRRPGGVI